MNYRLTIAAAIATMLASAALYSLVMGWAWFWVGCGAVVSVAIAGALTRIRVLPALLGPVAGAAALLIYVTVVFAGPESFARVVPTSLALRHLGLLASQGFQATSRFAPPAPATHGILLLFSTGVGIIAIATDLIAVRLRRPAVAGLALLILFCVPLTTTAHEGPLGTVVAFGMGMTGYLVMLSVDAKERLRLWGRLVTARRPAPADGSQVREPSGPSTKELSAAGRRIGLAAVALALFIPLLVPGLQNHKLFGRHGAGGPGGHATLPNPLVQMNEDLHATKVTHVLTYHSSDKVPQYLQVYVLSNLTTNTWTLAPGISRPVQNGKLPVPPGLAKGIKSTTQHTTIALAKGFSSGQPSLSFLPLPYPAAAVTVPGGWDTNPPTLTMYSTESLSGLSYSVTSQDVNPTEQQLERAGPVPPSIESQYLAVPAAFLPLAKIAEQVTKGQVTAWGKAVALQRWFANSGKFRYSLNVTQPATAQALKAFLTTDRRGYCQQFAFAMAVLARLLQIPARVAVGYTEGSSLGKGRWTVNTADAHAWPELYFQGAGWLRFEPTPAGTGGQATAIAPAYSLPPVLGVTPTASPTPTAGSTGGKTKTSQSGGGQLSKLQHLNGNATGGGAKLDGGAVPVVILIAVIIVIGLITPRTLRTLARRQRWLTATDDSRRARAAWLEFLGDLTDHGVAWAASESPRALCTRVSTVLRFSADETAALTRITHAEERARYAASAASPASLRADSAAVRRAVAQHSSRADRWRARLIGVSSLAPVRAGLLQALDVFSWLDVIAHLARNWARRGPGQQRPGPVARRADLS